jgi:hypothetical protein
LTRIDETARMAALEFLARLVARMLAAQKARRWLRIPAERTPTTATSGSASQRMRCPRFAKNSRR